MADVRTLQWVDLDDMPIRLVPPPPQLQYDYPTQEIDPEFYAELSQPFRDAAARVVVAEEGETHCQDCGDPIGWLLFEDDERPQQSGMRWLLVCVVATGATAVLVCEDCSPDRHAGLDN
jgi:hypothetical protein